MNAVKREEVKNYLRDLSRRPEHEGGLALPSIHRLRASLAVSKNTVIGALEELCDEGLLEARERQGFFVRRMKRRMAARETDISMLRYNRLEHAMASITCCHAGQRIVSLGGGVISEAVLASPELTHFLKGHARLTVHDLATYAPPQGSARLREAISASPILADGVNLTPENVLITNGAMEALRLALRQVKRRTGRRKIAIESPGYYLLQPLLEQEDFSFVPVPRTHEGLDLAALERVARGGDLAAFITNPSHQNPLGSSLPLAQKFEIASIADRHGLFLIEDEVYRGLSQDEKEAPAIFSFAPLRTIYVGSFSKTAVPVFRTGFVAAHESALREMLEDKFLMNLSNNGPSQELLAQFLLSRDFARHIKFVQGELRRCHRMALSQAQGFEDLGVFEDQPFRGGLFARFLFRSRLNVVEVYERAKAMGIVISPGELFYVPGSNELSEPSWMRVNISETREQSLARVLEFMRAFGAVRRRA